MTQAKDSLLAEEVRLWNTPLMGGYLLWQFTQGYCEMHPNGDAPIGLLHFMAAPLLANPQLNETISNRRKNLQSYVNGFEDKKCIDLLMTLPDRIRSRRTNTLAAIDAAICAGLLSWDSEYGKLYPNTPAKRPSRGKALRAEVTREGAKARVLGGWFSEHDVATVASYLGVVL